MKNLLVACTAIFGLCAAPQFALAQDEVADEIVKPKEPKSWHVYGDVNIALTQFSTSDGNNSATSDSMGNVYGRVGAKYKYIGAEVEIGQGLSDIEEDGFSLGVGTQLAAFGILRLPVQDNADIFLRAGYHSTDLEVGFDGFDPDLGNIDVSEDVTSDGFAFGVGGTFYFTDNLGVRGDITGYNTRDLIDANLIAASLGLTAKF